MPLTGNAITHFDTKTPSGCKSYLKRTMRAALYNICLCIGIVYVKKSQSILRGRLEKLSLVEQKLFEALALLAKLIADERTSFGNASGVRLNKPKHLVKLTLLQGGKCTNNFQNEV